MVVAQNRECVKATDKFHVKCVLSEKKLFWKDIVDKAKVVLPTSKLSFKKPEQATLPHPSWAWRCRLLGELPHSHREDTARVTTQ